jgi:hypothetical protein
MVVWCLFNTRKADYHAERGPKRPLDLPEASGMRFAHFNGHPTLYDGCTRHRNQRNERNNHETQDCCGHLRQVHLTFSLSRPQSMRA